MQLVMCLTTEARLTADPGVATSIPARSHTFVEVDYEIISTVEYETCVNEVLVNRLFKLAKEKSLAI